jgi:two-component system nitrate/nitrite response regulator NarL
MFDRTHLALGVYGFRSDGSSVPDRHFCSKNMEVSYLHMLSSQSQKTSFRSRDGLGWTASKPRKHENELQSNTNLESTFRVLIADRDSMSSDLLATSLTRDRGFQASGIRSADLMDRLLDGNIHLVVIAADIQFDAKSGFDLAQSVSRAHPAVSVVMLLNQSTPDSVVRAFRSGARGVFSRQHPVAEFPDCIEHVCKGYIWAGAQETTLLLDALSVLPSTDMAMALPMSSLTFRELQVTKCAARGKTNKAIACELGLSEHTVKNYLFRAFEKLGVSNRVELLFHLTLNGHSLSVAQPESPAEDISERARTST